MSIRLNKLLASRGVGARRKCDTIIAEGRVRVNGRVVTEPGTTVEEQRDRVELDGRALPGAQRHAYFVLNKPVGVITTLLDPQGRRTIAEFLPRGQRLFPVGRLDADTSGLLLLTNDGELAHHLMHPRYGVEKYYRVRLDQEPGNRQLERLARGVEFEPGVVSAPARVRRIDPGFDAIMIEIAIHEGRFRQVRRMCEAVGLVVTGLHRVGYGPIRLGPLARGMWRELSEAEVEKLRATSARPQRRAGAPARPPRTGRPAPASRPAPPAARRERPFDDEIEETWVGGGGPLGELEDDRPGEWPARPGRARGDDAFLEEHGDVPPRRESTKPWHAPEFRRGPRWPEVPRARRGRRSAARAPLPDRRGPRSAAGGVARAEAALRAARHGARSRAERSRRAPPRVRRFPAGHRAAGGIARPASGRAAGARPAPRFPRGARPTAGRAAGARPATGLAQPAAGLAQPARRPR